MFAVISKKEEFYPAQISGSFVRTREKNLVVELQAHQFTFQPQFEAQRKRSLWQVGWGAFWSKTWCLWRQPRTSHIEVGSVGPWVLFWALKKVLKRAKTLKKVLLRANLLFWVLKKVIKRVGLLKKRLKWVALLKRGLKWVGHSKKVLKRGDTQKSETLKKVLKRAKTLKKVLSRANLLCWVLKKVIKRVGLLKKSSNLARS